MDYISTRGEAQAVNFLDAVLIGLAGSGGCCRRADHGWSGDRRLNGPVAACRLRLQC